MNITLKIPYIAFKGETVSISIFPIMQGINVEN